MHYVAETITRFDAVMGAPVGLRIRRKVISLDIVSTAAVLGHHAVGKGSPNPHRNSEDGILCLGPFYNRADSIYHIGVDLSRVEVIPYHDLVFVSVNQHRRVRIRLRLAYAVGTMKYDFFVANKQN